MGGLTWYPAKCKFVLKTLPPLGMEHYYKLVYAQAKRQGYDTRTLKPATDGIHKFEIQTPAGKKVKFGRQGYGDYWMYTLMEHSGQVPWGTAEAKKYTFHRSHEAIRGNWRSNPYSPNALALNILW